MMLLFLCIICASTVDANRVDTSGWVGAQYQPMKSSNEDWLWHYDNYNATIGRELHLAKEVMALTAVRVFLHSAIFQADGGVTLIRSMGDFLGKANANEIKVGFVFFDDCWNHDGLDLKAPCQPRKGVHNGCWMASPQDNARTGGVQKFEKYVTDVVKAFKNDDRVAWWEVYNEPDFPGQHGVPAGSTNYSYVLRQTAYDWIKKLNPSQTVASCWDESSATDINDHHQYHLPWNSTLNGVFLNNTGRMQGGLVTEAGARWYHGWWEDSGSPLTVIDWLTKLRKNPAAPFVPGVMIDWEVMVSNSNTR
jgi:hypothetical protein